MPKTREELDELIRKHEQGDINVGKDQIWFEIKYIVEFIVTYIVVCFTVFTGIAAAQSYFGYGVVRLDVVSAQAQFFSGTVMFITALIFAFSYFAGMSVYTSSIWIRAWSPGGNTMDDRSLIGDMRRMMNPGQVVKGLLLGSIVTILFYYLYVDVNLV